MKGLLILILLITTSFAPTPNKARDLHVSAIGEERVITFETKFPQVAKDDAVYTAYLQKYYKGHEDEFINLMLWDQ